MGGIGLSITYVLPLVLVAWVWVVGAGRRHFRTVVLLLLPLVYATHWFALERFRGWPAAAPPPAEFELVAVDFVEPDRQRQDDGSIYLWIRTRPLTPPRAHVLDYSRELHEMLHKAKLQMEKGIRQVGRSAGREAEGDGVSIGNGVMLLVEDRPPPVLPPKTL